MAKYAISAFGHFEWHPNYTASDFCGNPLKLSFAEGEGRVGSGGRWDQVILNCYDPGLPSLRAQGGGNMQHLERDVFFSLLLKLSIGYRLFQ